MFSALDILLGLAGLLVAAAISAPFLLLRRAPRPVPRAATVAHKLQKQPS